jgi:gluconokinase
MSDPLVVTLDIGSSSVRTLLFDGSGHQLPGLGVQLPYRIATTQDGGVEVDGDELAALAIEALSNLHDHMKSGGLRPSAVCCSAFWHSFLGVGNDSRPTTPIIHLFDTRSAAQVEELKKRLDPASTHARTGCVLHTSYWPAKLLWLASERNEAFAATARWLSFGEYLYERVCGRPALSSSMASGSGIWNQNANDYDGETLSVLPVRREQLFPRSELDQSRNGLSGDFKAQWPLFDGIPWYPAVGDGACNNIGSGCITRDRFSLMVGTSGAMRAVLEQDRVEIPGGIWCYRVDARRFVLGGAVSNGGEVFAWMRRTLALPAPDQIEQEIAAMEPGAHGLTVVPLFAGERSPNWRGSARAAFAGMNLDTTPIEITRAALESVALTFRQIYEIMAARLGEPVEVIASGGALAHSLAWTQMMADALQRPVSFCLEPEASSRGAALLALERLRAIGHIRDLPAQMGRVFQARGETRAAYDRMFKAMVDLYEKTSHG